ncbi:MAG TPA: hypothetical protein PLD20_19730 [Blastocatellia bacterium]|nr:hypothetical protein [Blastocatellia bacterium]HMV87880.1 hypothetical protein [Blastocatellia bacterium]HMX29152.1 hypothetical protein [Blastocatellia bacterium]HMY72809.1 hypothetical protein [Blastocatellia bacterium]HMZ20179.1 hypothetical protein [Blastocatellia bacterium]
MSAVAQLKTVVEKDLLLNEITGDLPQAMSLVEQLRKEAQELRERIAENIQLAEQKKFLLSIASLEEQLLRSKLVKSQFFQT